jgi:ribosome-associated translation inhibitor RaiA
MVDTFEKLDIGLDKVDYVVHISDIHIRLTKRHEEYREAFEKLYAEIVKDARKHGDYQYWRHTS